MAFESHHSCVLLSDKTAEMAVFPFYLAAKFYPDPVRGISICLRQFDGALVVSSEYLHKSPVVLIRGIIHPEASKYVATEDFF